MHPSMYFELLKEGVTIVKIGGVGESLAKDFMMFKGLTLVRKGV